MSDEVHQARQEFIESLDEMRNQAASLPRGNQERDLLVKSAKALQDFQDHLSKHPEEVPEFLAAQDRFWEEWGPTIEANQEKMAAAGFLQRYREWQEKRGKP